jgi:hypothetical protein
MNWRGRDPVMRGLAQTTDPSTTCSDGGRSTDSPALKAAVLEQVYEELTADMQEEEEVEMNFDDYENYTSNGHRTTRQMDTGLAAWFEVKMDTSSRKNGVVFNISTQRWLKMLPPGAPLGLWLLKGSAQQ